MQSKNFGLIIYIKHIKDNDLYIKILSDNDNIISGLVYGGNSTKKRSIYQLGYFIEFIQLLKNKNSVTSINGEIAIPFIGTILNNKFKSFALLSIVSILNKSIYEGQKINGLFISINNLINIIINNKYWLTDFCEWHFYLLKLIGYEIDYTKNSNLKYFNLNSLDFHKIYIDNNSILFPHELFRDKNIINYQSIKSFFAIFETVFKNNHLNNFDDKMPFYFVNFKTLILKQLKK